MDKVEHRAFTEGVELRSSDDPGETDAARMAVGYGAVFETETREGLPFVEKFAAGAFTKTINEADIRALFNHDPNNLIGRTAAGTLRLSQDKRGLAYSVDLPDTQMGRDVRTLLERGDISGSSISFIATDVDWEETRDGSPLRIVRGARLFDVGPVTYPAYPDAGVALRSLAAESGVNIADVITAAEQGDLQAVLAHAKELDEREAKPEAVVETPRSFYHRSAH